LHDKKALIVLDDAADADQVQALLVSESCCAMIITSRHTFVLSGTHPIRLGSLSLSESKALLLSICPRLGPAPHVQTLKAIQSSDEDIPAKISELCGSLPMALRLAGSVLAEQVDLDPSEYEARLKTSQTRLELINASFSLSYQSLDPETQVMWCLLSVFAGSFDKAAASALWQIEDDRTQFTLSKLGSYSLVEYSPDTARYRLHDLARLFANSNLDSSIRVTAEKCLARHFVAVLQKVDKLYVTGGDSLQHGLSLFDLEWENIRGGQGWAAIQGVAGDDEMAHLCIMYTDYGKRILSLRRSPSEQITWLEAALDCSRRLRDRPSERTILDSLGSAYVTLGEAKHSAEYHDECLAVARDTGDRSSERIALCGLGRAYFDLGELARGVESYQQAIAIARESQDRQAEGNALWGLGNACLNTGNPDQAIEYSKQALAIAQEIIDRHLEAHILLTMGCAHLLLKNKAEATKNFDKCINMFEASEQSVCRADSLRSMGRAYRAVGKLRQSVNCLVEASEGFGDAGDLLDEQNTLRDLGRVLESLGYMKWAEESYEKALAIARRMNDLRSECRILFALGNLHASQGDFSCAFVLFKRALGLSTETNDHTLEAHIVEHLGLAALALGKPQESVEYIERGVAILRQCGRKRCESHAEMNLATAYLSMGNRSKASELGRFAMKSTLSSLSPTVPNVDIDEWIPSESSIFIALVRVKTWLQPIRSRFRPTNNRLSRAFSKVGGRLLLRLGKDI
jgi:tetratricopeptide (TPR) repeat protein